jgi:hypothetical protein
LISGRARSPLVVVATTGSITQVVALAKESRGVRAPPAPLSPAPPRQNLTGTAKCRVERGLRELVRPVVLASAGASSSPTQPSISCRVTRSRSGHCTTTDCPGKHTCWTCAGHRSEHHQSHDPQHDERCGRRVDVQVTVLALTDAAKHALETVTGPAAGTSLPGYTGGGLGP